MSEEKVPYEITDGGSTFLLWKGTAGCVVTVAGLQSTFTMCMGGVEMLRTGENTTPAWNAFVESATHTDTGRNHDS